MDLRFDPMEIEYNVFDDEAFEKCKLRMEQTLFPKREFKSEEQRQHYTLRWHEELECPTFEELIHCLAYLHLREQYCHWCRDYDIDKTIVEHEHIMGNAGRYRGVLCKRCNVIEGRIKHMTHREKVDHLYNKLANRVNYDYQWIEACINKWYVIKKLK